MRILFFGGNSDIARELALQLARPGDHFLLAVRGESAARSLRDQLEKMDRVRATIRKWDALEMESHPLFFRDAVQELGGLEVVVYCAGLLGEQQRAQENFALAREVLDVNFTGAMAVLEPAAAFFEKQRRGRILALSSVAGERGRKSNYIYGAAKAALTVYLQGLSHRLQASGVGVRIAKLGYVETKMTAGLESVPKLLRTTPEKAARGILRLWNSGSESRYVPWIWMPVMLLVRLLPAWIFRKTKL